MKRNCSGAKDLRYLSWVLLLVSAVVAFSQPTSRSCFFVANEGQWPGEFAFQYDGGGGSWFVTKNGLTIDLKQYQVSPQNGLPFGGTEGGYSNRDPYDNRDPEPRMVKGHVLKVNLVNGNQDAVIEGADKLASYSNYFLGQDKSKWRSRVGHYRKVVAKEVWPGIDVEYRAEPQGVEMVFRLQPGADISQIQVEYEGLDSPLSVDNKGNIVLKTSLGNLIEQAPFAYQIEHRRQSEVPVHYALTESGYRLIADNYNHARELVIDPLLYGSYIGGTGMEDATNVIADPAGGFVVCGESNADGFPVTPGAYQTEANGWHGFVTRFNEGGSDLVFSTYLGTPFPVQGRDVFLNAICLIDSGRIVCGGCTKDNFWPVTDNAYQDTLTNQGHYDVVLSILSVDGTELVYSTYIGSTYYDTCYDIIYDGQGMIYCCGEGGGANGSIPFPTTPDAVFTEQGLTNAFLLRFDLSRMTIDYSTLLPADYPTWLSAYRLFLVEQGVIWMTGATPATDLPITPDAIQTERDGPPDEAISDGFFTLWDLNANELSYCSYWGGDKSDNVISLSFLGDSLVLVGGSTRSSNFPVTEGVFEPVDADSIEGHMKGYITIMNPYEEIIASTLFGAACDLTAIAGLRVDSTGISFYGLVIGQGLPVSPNAYDSLWNNDYDVFLARLSPDLRYLEYGSYLGGGGPENFIDGHFDDSGNAWISGSTSSGNLPTTEGAYDRDYGGVGDGFVFCFEIPDLDTPVNVRPVIPCGFSMSVFPNPFNPSTTISFSLPHQAQTSLEVFNVLGQAVYSVDLGQLPAGEYRHLLNAASLPSGTYLTRLNAGNVQEVKKMAVVR